MRNPFHLAALFLSTVAMMSAAEGPSARWERVPVNGGAELLTLFSTPPGEASNLNSEEVPILSVLRDTLNDNNPDNDRLRYVWLLGEQRRGTLVRWLTPEPGAGDLPRPVVDLAAPAKGIWKSVLRAIVQSLILDPSGALIRVPSRSYLSSQDGSRTVRLFEALHVMVRLEEEAQAGPLAPHEYSQVLARLLLADRTFGGLVRDRSIGRVLEGELADRRQAVG
jgi:hypothetical protein